MCGDAVARNKYSIIGERIYRGSRAGILYEQADVPYCMVLASSGSTNDGNPALSLRQQETHSLSLVVALLLVYNVQSVGIFLAVLRAYRVTVAHNGIRGVAE